VTIPVNVASKVVIGLSGVDSSLVAAIATAALGPENVLGVLMPSPTVPIILFRTLCN